MKNDPGYLKAYYRRAAAHMSLGKFKLALSDFELVSKRRPNDSEAKKKFVECNKIVKKMAFERAIAVDRPEKTLAEMYQSLESISIEDDYNGPKLEDDKTVTLDFMKQLMLHYKDQKKLHKKYAYKVGTLTSRLHCLFHGKLLCRFYTTWMPSYVNSHRWWMWKFPMTESSPSAETFTVNFMTWWTSSRRMDCRVKPIHICSTEISSIEVRSHVQFYLLRIYNSPFNPNWARFVQHWMHFHALWIQTALSESLLHESRQPWVN